MLNQDETGPPLFLRAGGSLDNTQQAAFFDVDGTLTTTTTMFRFLEYYLAVSGQPPYVYWDERQRLKKMTNSGVSRVDTSRAYFTNYKGANAAEVASCAEDWFVIELGLGNFFNEHVLAALHMHQQAEDLIVLVSGSFCACLTPLARHVGADALICSEPELVSGTYTGKIHQPMIGDAKAQAVHHLAIRHHIDLPASIAYGDHPSDLPLLGTTGRATIVGSDPMMLRWASDKNWQLLPSASKLPALPAEVSVNRGYVVPVSDDLGG